MHFHLVVYYAHLLDLYWTKDSRRKFLWNRTPKYPTRPGLWNQQSVRKGISYILWLGDILGWYLGLLFLYSLFYNLIHMRSILVYMISKYHYVLVIIFTYVANWSHINSINKYIIIISRIIYIIHYGTALYSGYFVTS